MDAVTHPPLPVNEPVLDYAPGSAERAAPGGRARGGDRTRSSCGADHRRRQAHGRPASAFDVVAPFDHRRVLGTSANATQADAAGRGRRPRWPPPPAGARWPSTTAPRSCCAPPSCWPGRGGRWINAATMLGQAKTALPGGDRLGLRAGRLLALQRALRPADPGRAADRELPGHLEPHRPPAAGGLRLRGHAVQLHRDRRQPADRARAHGQRGGLEAVDHAAAGGVADSCSCWIEAGLPDGGDQHAAGRRRRRSPRWC